MGILRSLRSVASFDAPVVSARKRRFARAANIADLRLIAERRLPGGIFDYIDGAAEDETSLRNNSRAFGNYEFRPRVMRDVSSVDTTASLLGHRLQVPLVFSPKIGRAHV